MHTYLFDFTTLQLSLTNLYVLHIFATTGVIVTDLLGQRFTQLCMLRRTDNERMGAESEEVQESKCNG